MSTRTITVAHGLRLLPLREVLAFASAFGRAWMVHSGHAIDSGAVPGSVTVSAAMDGRVYVKRINFQRKRTDRAGEYAYSMLTREPLLAVYIDEQGAQRVCGTAEYPLHLSMSPGGAVYDCVLEGRDTEDDRYI